MRRRRIRVGGRRSRAARSTIVVAGVVTLLVIGIAAAWCDGESATPETDGSPFARPSPTVARAATPDAVITCAPPYPTPPYTADTVFCADPGRLTPAPLVRVIDGDTIVVRVAGADETVRVFGIDTPERGEACFDDAADRIHELASGGVRLLADQRERDRFGRLLRYVYTDGGLSIDAVMVSEGLAHAWRDDGALRLPLIALEERARNEHAGCIWR
jgi:endonuclease YncB( thermonuclease family)